MALRDASPPASLAHGPVRRRLADPRSIRPPELDVQVSEPVKGRAQRIDAAAIGVLKLRLQCCTPMLLAHLSSLDFVGAPWCDRVVRRVGHSP